MGSSFIYFQSESTQNGCFLSNTNNNEDGRSSYTIIYVILGNNLACRVQHLTVKEKKKEGNTDSIVYAVCTQRNRSIVLMILRLLSWFKRNMVIYILYYTICNVYVYKYTF